MRSMPEIPETGWVAPTEFPNLHGAKVVALDTETYDPELLTHGPGWARGKGHIVGISVGVPEGGRWYFPMRHTIRKEENLEPDRVLSWARDHLTDPNTAIVGANLTYDVGWLRHEDVRVTGPLYDVQFAEALLREELTVALDDLGERYLGEGKETFELYEWCSAYYDGGVGPQQRANIYRAPPSLVGPYAISDVDLPLRIMEKQWPRLLDEDLMGLFRLECELIYLMIEMRFAGVTIDLDMTEQLKDRMDEELKLIDKELKDLVGFEVNVNANDSLGKAFDALGYPYGLTATGKPSFTKGFLKKQQHSLAHLILKKRAREKLKGTFLESYLLESHVDGKVYGQFHQLRGTGGGTRSGRFSSSTPNLQNIPARSELGKLVRKAFVPDEGHARWIKADYSQIEYRGLAHYAVGPGADDVRAQYQRDPNTDFHELVKGIIHTVTGRDLDRALVKNINFGTAYGMGEPGLARYMNLEQRVARELFEAIHHAAPFLKSTMQATMEEAERHGVITTILGRKSRFNLWVPGNYSEAAKPLPLDKAILTYANPRRAYVHKALNRRLQGSAADLLKVAMLKCWKDGLFDVVGVPRLTVHDELDFSDPGGHEEVFAEIYRIMETAVPFLVPIRVSVSIGASWGDVD